MVNLEKEALNNAKIKAFLSKYGNHYPMAIRQEITYRLAMDFDYRDKMDVMQQIYSYLGLIPDSENVYKVYLELMKEHFSIDGNILEVGCGYVPALATLIHEEQKQLGSGTITVYDPNIVTRDYHGIMYKRQPFTNIEPIGKYNLMIATMPCEGTETIIYRACRENKDLFLALCGCIHFKDEKRNKELTSTDWENYIYDLIKNSFKEAEINIDYLDKKFKRPQKVLSIKQKNKGVW